MDNQTNTCSMCGTAFKSQDEMMAHGSTAHQMDQNKNDQTPSKSQEKIKCQMCGATFSSQEEMNAHAKEKHAGGM